jgi:hypothetical protein
MRLARMLLAISILGLTAACEPPPEFVATLSDPGEAGYDTRVLGQWYQEIEDGVTVLAAISDAATAPDVDAPVPEQGGKRLRVILTVQDVRENDAVSLPFSAFASRVDGMLYYNLAHTQAPYAWDVTVPDRPPGHYIVRAFFPTPDSMLVCLLSGFTEADQQASGLASRDIDQPIRLNGSPLQNGDDWEHKFVDGSRDDLRRFVSRDNASRFTPALYLARVGTPWLDPVEDPQQWARINLYRDQCNVDELREP